MIGEMRLMPAWVVCGVHRWPDGVRLIASTKVTGGELTMEMDEPEYLYQMYEPPYVRTQTITLSTRMTTYVIVDAPTFAEAWEHLLRTWSPTDQATDTPAIEARRDLTAGEFL